MSVQIDGRGRLGPGRLLVMGAVVLLTIGAPWAWAREAPTEPVVDPTPSPGEPSGDPRNEWAPGPAPDLVRPSRLSTLPRMPRLRPLTPGARELVGSGARQSSIVAALLKQIEGSDLVVYVTDEMRRAPRGAAAHTVFLSDGGETRYLLIRIDPWRLMLNDRIASLGHELQHALEIAAAPEVRDAEGMAALYRRIGWEAEAGRYESEAARKIGNLIHRQIGGGGA